MVSSLFYRLGAGARSSPKKAQRSLYSMAKDTLKSMMVLFGYILVCVDFTGATCIVLAVLLEVPNLLCVAIVSYIVNAVLIPSLVCEFGAELRIMVQYYAGIGDDECACYVATNKSLTIIVVAAEACFAVLGGVAVASRIGFLVRVRRFMIKQHRAPVDVGKVRKYGTSV